MSTAYNTPAYDGTPRNAASRWRESQSQYAYRVEDRTKFSAERFPLTPGDAVTSFRGEVWSFDRVSRPAYGHSEGRVQVSRECPQAYDRSPSQGGGRECVHSWHTGAIERQDYFPSVFDLYLGDAQGNEA